MGEECFEILLPTRGYGPCANCFNPEPSQDGVSSDWILHKLAEDKNIYSHPITPHAEGHVDPHAEGHVKIRSKIMILKDKYNYLSDTIQYSDASPQS